MSPRVLDQFASMDGPVGRTCPDVGRSRSLALTAAAAGVALARGAALFLGGFTLLNLVGVLRAPSTFDENVLWLDVRELPGPLPWVVLVAAGLALTAFALAPSMRPWRRIATLVTLSVVLVLMALDAAVFFAAAARGDIEPARSVPLSLLLALVVGAVVWAAARPRRPAPRRTTLLLIVLALLVCVALFPLAQVYFFGTTDYRGLLAPDATAVVFGAQVHRNGMPSSSLNDRVLTAVDLYRSGAVDRLLMSGAVGESGYDEALVMRDLAVARGVPAGDVLVDSRGASTDATVRDTLDILAPGTSGSRVAAVSQFYHLPRVKLAFQRAGLDVLTVPARQRRPIAETPRLVLREIPAFWVYYLRAVFL
jgi:vancomycin permeability regulator SanA